jgi:hypothetical protein
MRPDTRLGLDCARRDPNARGLLLASAVDSGGGGLAARFKFEQLCSTATDPQDERDGVLAERATVITPPDQWQLEVQIVHWHGDPWVGGQRASVVYDSAVQALRGCPTADARGSVTQLNHPQNLGVGIAAAITTAGAKPITAHEYLAQSTNSSTIVDLVLWSSSPPQRPWSEVDDQRVVDAMLKPLCTAYVNSCM